MFLTELTVIFRMHCLSAQSFLPLHFLSTYNEKESLSHKAFMSVMSKYIITVSGILNKVAKESLSILYFQLKNLHTFKECNLENVFSSFF